ncbi:MAG: lysophospholipid acyltransferase family protein [Deltaproteobacteria bacterium]
MNMKIKIAVFLNNIVPLPVKRALAVGLSRLVYHLLHKHKLIAVHNLTRSFPEKSLDDILCIIKDSYASFALVFVEFMEILKLNKDNLHEWVSVKGLDHYENACREGKGVLLFTAHFGNWEMGSAALAILSRPPFFMARALDSPFLEMISTSTRVKLGIGNLHKENAMRMLLPLLRRGEPIILLIDQNVAAKEGVFVNFFGRPACATTGVALMAMHTGAAVLPIFTTRMPDGRYLTEIGPKVETVQTGNREPDMLQNTQNYNSIIEDHVRKYPGQWLWLHQRWKTKRCQAKKKS